MTEYIIFMLALSDCAKHSLVPSDCTVFLFKRILLPSAAPDEDPELLEILSALAARSPSSSERSFGSHGTLFQVTDDHPFTISCGRTNVRSFPNSK